MTIRYLDHAAKVASPIGVQWFAPGLIDVDAYPLITPHIQSGTAWNRPMVPEFKLKRCCPACEGAMA